MMASMVDSNDRLSNAGKLQFDGGTLDQLEQESPYAAIDELWQELTAGQELYLLPTPPLSPQCFTPRTTEPSTPATTPEGGSDTDYVCGYQDNIMNNIMEYEQVMEMFAEAEREIRKNTQTSSQQEDLLLQDCMWNGGSMQVKNQLSAISDPSIKATDITDTPPNSQVPEPTTDDSEPNCVEPSAVFPALVKTERTRVLRAAATVEPPSTTRPPHCCSDSEEEIDVVTVERGPEQGQKKVARPRLPSSSMTKKGKYSKKKRSKRSSRGGSHDSNESDEEARRASHNVLERKRRNDLKNSFDILRMRIPDLEENQRAPKVVILRKAVDYINQLKINQKKMDDEYSRQTARHKRLLERLAKLKNSFS